MAADVLLGSVYFEEATGDDSAADVLQVTFQGGAPGTTLDRLVIDGDKTGDGLSAGDVFFDVAEGGLGAFHHVGLSIEGHEGFDVVGVTVVDGGSQIAFDLRGFEPGEVLVFSVDADEVQFIDPAAGEGTAVETGSVDTNPLVEGAEFQRSILTGHFSAPAYEDASLQAIYWDAYDARIAEAEAAAGAALGLPRDRHDTARDLSDRTAGAVAHEAQTPLPTIAGTVFHDGNLDNDQDASVEPGIAGVELELWRYDDTRGDYVDTGLRETTDTNGDYLFVDDGGRGGQATFELSEGTLTIESLQPGLATNGITVRFEQALTAPAAFPSVEFDPDARELTVTVSSSASTSFEHIHQQLLEHGFIASSPTSGGAFNPVLDGRPSASTSGARARLMPGRYQLREVQPNGYYSVGAQAGTVRGQTVGVVVNPNIISDIELPAAADSINNDFAEALPASISGYIYEDDNQDAAFQRGSEAGIAGVQIRVIPVQAIDHSAQAITVATDASGYWLAEGLVPGEYRVEEVATPGGYVDGLDAAGTVDGVTVGRAINPGDSIVDITLGGDQHGVNYNFGEVRLGSLAGRVHLSTDGDCDFEATDVPLEGVQVDLRDNKGNVLRTTFSGANGEYVFVDLPPGEYQIQEHTPAKYNDRPVFDGDEHVGSAGGYVIADDTIGGIVLAAGENATQYDFCENVGANISGWVYHDADNNGNREATEEGIGGATLELLDADGRPTGVTATTSSAGYYEFTDIAPGTWGVREVQPDGWIDGRDAPGTHGGMAENPGDRITGAVLGFASFGEDYNFGELLPASIGGTVQASTDGTCDFENPEIPLAGVRVDLLNADGTLVATTRTDALGGYRFTGVAPGEYQIIEHQPAEHDGRKLFDGDEQVGDAGGHLFGSNGIRGIHLGSGQVAGGYHFCEHLGAMLSGWVYHDRDNDGVRDAGEQGIGGVTLLLLDADMNPTGTSVTTSADGATAGFYKFNDLPPGVYGLMEVQPADWLDGVDTPGNLGGIAEPSPPGDKLHSFELDFGRSGTDYNFGELLPASIRGQVHATTDPQCIPQPGEPAIEGVRVELLDATGQVIADTVTDGNGEYSFENLRPGNYTVREIQPAEYFDGGAHVGDGGGALLNTNIIADVEVRSGDHLVEYDFCEHPAAALSGRVFQDGPPIAAFDDLPSDISTIRDGQWTPDDRPLAGVVLELRHGRSGDPIFGFEALPGLYPFAEPIRAVTDASGFYEFRGLPGGTYAVVEVHPEGMIDGIDTPGSTGGYAVNYSEVKATADPAKPETTPGLSQQRTIDQFRTQFGTDVIVLIPLQYGQQSVENNFSEVTTQRLIVPPAPPDAPDPPPPLPPLTFIPQPPEFVPLEFAEASSLPFHYSLRARDYTWHLSIVNAGFPRAVHTGTAKHHLTGSQFNLATWQGTVMDEAAWTMVERDRLQPARFEKVLFGNRRARPVAGDFNGDGISEIGVFIDGEWHIDLDGDRRWDEDDLWAKLGTRDDLPAVGDWDGDGKADIGVFGPAWPRDPQAVAYEPGLPDPENRYVGRQKNVPPAEDEASGGKRVMQRSVRGRTRAHPIDHVFHYGTAYDVPVTGDWNGDGISTIGVFRGGVWHLDVDGDGRFTSRDVAAQFGTQGDLPVVGDFNGDGIDEIGTWRAGEWLLDTYRDYRFDAKDEVHRLGGVGDLPVVGDWDGDGTDDLAVFHPNGTAEQIAQRPDTAVVEE